MPDPRDLDQLDKEDLARPSTEDVPPPPDEEIEEEEDDEEDDD